MSALIWWGVLATYLVGFLPSGVAGARFVSSRRPYCHSENRSNFDWYSAHYCHDHCRPGCWRADASPRLIDCLSGTGLALVWPILLLPAAVYYLSRTPSQPTLWSTDELARIERELGLGEQR